MACRFPDFYLSYSLLIKTTNRQVCHSFNFLTIMICSHNFCIKTIETTWLTIYNNFLYSINLTIFFRHKSSLMFRSQSRTVALHFDVVPSISATTIRWKIYLWFYSFFAFAYFYSLINWVRPLTTSSCGNRQLAGGFGFLGHFHRRSRYSI